MYRYRNILVIIIVPMLILSFFGCAESENGGVLHVFDLPAQAQIEGERYGVPFSAVLTLHADSSEMRFTSPESMKGITVSSSGEVWGSKLGELELTGEAAKLIGAPLRAFKDRGKVISVQKDGGKTLISTESENGLFEYVIESKSGLPLQITEISADGALVMNINIKKYEIKEEE